MAREVSSEHLDTTHQHTNNDEHQMESGKTHQTAKRKEENDA